MKKAIILAMALAMTPALASVSQAAREIKNETVKEECGACHMAYHPRFLPALSWTKIMKNLGNHFGEDASLDEETTKQIRRYLISHAGRERGENPPIRISKLKWFVHEHGSKLSERGKKKAGTFSNCVACHKGAERGYFDDD